MNPNAEDSLRSCKSCRKVFDLNDYDGQVDNQDFCSSECESEYRQELADFRFEMAKDGACEDAYEKEKVVE